MIVAGVAVAFWAFAGMHQGWTQTSVPIKTMDEVTGIEGVRYEKRFVPGLDFLGAAILVSGVLGGLTLFQRGDQQS